MSPPKKATDTSSQLARFRRPDKDQQAKDGAGASSDSEQTAAVLTKVPDAISLCQSTLTTKIEEVKINISLIRQDMNKLCDRVTEAETRISRAEDILRPLQHTTDHVQRQLQQLRCKKDDMENRLRHCNLIFTGLPESVEGIVSTGFLEDLSPPMVGRLFQLCLQWKEFTVFQHDPHLREPPPPVCSLPGFSTLTIETKFSA